MVGKKGIVRAQAVGKSRIWASVYARVEINTGDVILCTIALLRERASSCRRARLADGMNNAASDVGAVGVSSVDLKTKSHQRCYNLEGRCAHTLSDRLA